MKSAAALLFCLLSSPALGQPYFLASFGSAELKAGVAEGSASVVMLGAGYRLTESFGVELSYLDTTDAASVNRDIGQSIQQVTTAKVETSGYGFFARWTAPIGQTLRLGARAGAHRLTSSMEERIIEQDNAPPFNPRVLAATKMEKSEWVPALALLGDLVLGKNARLGLAIEFARGDALESMRSVTGSVQILF